MYQNSTLDSDRNAWFESLQSGSEYLVKDLDAYNDHLEISLHNVDTLDVDLLEVEGLHKKEAQIVGLQWGTDKHTRTVMSRFAWLIPGVVYQRYNHQAFLTELQITNVEAKTYITDQKNLVGALRQKVLYQNGRFKDILLDYEARYKDEDLKGLNSLAENGLKELKIWMIKMNGDPEMLDRAGNTETKEAPKPEVTKK